jgi:hypothetical protein
MPMPISMVRTTLRMYCSSSINKTLAVAKRSTNGLESVDIGGPRSLQQM